MKSTDDPIPIRVKLNWTLHGLKSRNNHRRWSSQLFLPLGSPKGRSDITPPSPHRSLWGSPQLPFYYSFHSFFLALDQSLTSFSLSYFATQGTCAVYADFRKSFTSPPERLSFLAKRVKWCISEIIFSLTWIVLPSQLTDEPKSCSPRPPQVHLWNTIQRLTASLFF